MIPSAYEFGPFRLEPAQRVLTRDGAPVALTAKAFDTLVALVELRDRVAEKAELISRVWPDHVVDEGNLTQQISTLRKALGDGREGQSYVATVPTRGYRFVARVVEQRALPSATTDAAPPEGPPARDARSILQRSWPALALAVAGLAIWMLVSERRPTSGAIRSVAVLPLANLSGDMGEDYVADGFTEALITDLATAPALRVTSRTSSMSYKGKREPLAAVAQALGVEWVIEGSVQRAGDQLRVSVQLVDASVNRQIWAQRYDRPASDLLAAQAEIARDVARAAGTSVEIVEPGSGPQPSAQELYLRARERWSRRMPEDLVRAITLLAEAVRLEPGFARAHAALADCHLVMPNYGIASPRESYAQARAAAERALALDPALPSARSALAFVHLHDDFDWEASGRELQAVLASSPSDVVTHQRWAEWLSARGRPDAAVREMDEVLRLDPLSASAQANAGRLLFFARSYPQAIAQLERARDLGPRFVWTHGLLVLAHVRAGQPAEAMAVARVIEDLDEPSSVPKAHALVASGRSQEAREILAVLEARAREGAQMAYHLAGVRAVLGDSSEALDWLEQAVDRREALAIFLAVDPAFDGLRAEPRYAVLARKTGL